jgi:hypothetical protein
MYVKYAVTVHSMYRVIYSVYIEVCEFIFASLIVDLKQVPHYPTAPLPHLPVYPNSSPSYSSICTMATLNRTVTRIKDKKLLL